MIDPPCRTGEKGDEGKSKEGETGGKRVHKIGKGCLGAGHTIRSQDVPLVEWPTAVCAQ